MASKVQNEEARRPLLGGSRGSGIYGADSSTAAADSTGPDQDAVPTTTDPEQAAAAAAAHGTFQRNLGAVDAFAIVISIVIGSGIFTSPGSIDSNVPSPGIALVVWLVGGILAWTGASTMAELGTAIPGEGMIFINLLLLLTFTERYMPLFH